MRFPAKLQKKRKVKKINKTQFIEAIAAKTNLKKKDAEAALNAVTDIIGES